MKSVTIPASVTTIGAYAFGIYYDETKGGDHTVDGFTIYSEKGSASEVFAKDNGYSFAEPPKVVVILGDIDGDDDVTIMDATCLQRHIAELSTENYVEAADADHDGDNTIMDATAVQRYLAELPTYSGINNPI